MPTWVRVGGSESNTFDMRGRVQNYYGIAPDFPRGAVVSDEDAPTVAMAAALAESRDAGAFRILELEALVRIKLTAFRDKHRTHLRDLIDFHIDGCQPCVAFMNTYRGTISATRTLPSTPVPPELQHRRRPGREGGLAGLVLTPEGCKRVEEAVGRDTAIGHLDGGQQDRRHTGLGDEFGSAANQQRRAHGQDDEDDGLVEMAKQTGPVP